jgi:hypothetical protein
MMAVQKPTGSSGPRLRLAAQLAVAVLALSAGAAAAQSNAPVTGSMGSADPRSVAAPVVQPMPAPADAAQTQAAQATASPAQASRVPRDVVRRDTPLRVGEHARDGMLGDETQALLALQASNLAAGPGLPMLGATASRAYKRYLDSFTYPIPQFYPTMIQSDSGNGGGGGGGGGGAASGGAGAGASQ